MNAKNKKSSWIPELDGLRVIMIFLVSAYHIWQQSWLTPRIGHITMDPLLRSGYLWVDGTVTLSAFLLALPYARSRMEGTPWPNTKAFYRRRAIRILPSYYFILLLVLLAVCLPWQLYHSPQYLVKDLATHLTFTFPFFRDTYINTPLGAACWTLAIEAQAYLIYPLLAAGARRHPVAVPLGMAAVGWGFRLWCLWSLEEYSMVVNQMLNFLDIYALGMGLAPLYLKMKTLDAKKIAGRSGKRERSTPWGTLLPVLATLAFAGAVWGLAYLVRLYAGSSVGSASRGLGGWLVQLLGNPAAGSNYVIIQRNQMVYRPLLALCFGVLILTAPLSVKPLRVLLGNRVTHFLAGISMNYYLIHQTIIVHMRRLQFPYSVAEYPNQAGEQPWQSQYTLLAFALSLLAAILITYLIERPASRWLNGRFRRE